MKNLQIAVAQFEPKDGDKNYNLQVIENLTAKAKKQGAEVVCFHEMSITAYTFFKDLSREEVIQFAEKVPDGESVIKLIELAKKYDVHILAGLVEIEDDKIYNTYVCVSSEGLVSKFRKIHPFISEFMSAGSQYVTFKIKNWTCGILICYDNNVIENVRATALLGADIIFAPHVTGCTPSTFPNRGYVSDELWQNRHQNPEALQAEFDSPKGRGWLLRWLPARAYDNGVYYVFTNPIGYDGEHLKNGNSMILDPFGEILTETRSFENEISVATLTPEKSKLANGKRYRNARKPELYRGIIGKEHQSETKPIWKTK